MLRYHTSTLQDHRGDLTTLQVLQEVCPDNTTEVVQLYAAGDTLWHWTTDCAEAQFSDEFAQNPLFTVTRDTNSSCSVYLEVTDSCFGTRTCGAVLASTCCTEGYDICNVCGGNGTSCLDCNGVPFGKSSVDSCGICGGDDSTCCNNYLGINSVLWDYILVPEAVNDAIFRLEDTYVVTFSSPNFQDTLCWNGHGIIYPSWKICLNE